MTGHQQAHGHDRVVRAQPQVAQLRAHAVDLAGDQVQAAPDRLGLLVRVGLGQAPQQAAPLGACRLQPILRCHVLARHVAALLALPDHRSQRRQVAQSRAHAIARDAQREVAAALVAARVDRRAEHEAAVTIGDRGHLIGHLGHVLERHVEVQREGPLDLAVGLRGGEVAAGRARACLRLVLGDRQRVVGRLLRTAASRASGRIVVTTGRPRRPARGEDHAHDQGQRDQGADDRQPEPAREPAGRARRRQPPQRRFLAGTRRLGTCASRPGGDWKARLDPSAQLLGERRVGARRVGTQRQRQLLQLPRERVRVGRGAARQGVVHRGQLALHQGVSHGMPFAAWSGCGASGCRPPSRIARARSRSRCWRDRRRT